MQGGQLYEQRQGEPTTYKRSMTVLWSRARHQRHMTIYPTKFVIGKRNVTIRYIFCVWLCNMNIVIVVNPT